jgi:protein ImuB
VFDPPVPAELLDARDQPVAITGRGEQRHAPARVHSQIVDGAVDVWAGPWAYDERWWDRNTRRRCARYQLVVGNIACIAVIENGRAAIEAIYD